MSLQTGNRVSRRRWTEKPATQAVIDRVHELANTEAHAPLTDDPFLFEWARNVPILDFVPPEASPGSPG